MKYPAQNLEKMRLDSLDHIKSMLPNKPLVVDIDVARQAINQAEENTRELVARLHDRDRYIAQLKALLRLTVPHVQSPTLKANINIHLVDADNVAIGRLIAKAPVMESLLKSCVKEFRRLQTRHSIAEFESVEQLIKRIHEETP